MTSIRAGSLVVSCQARPDNPLHGATYMAAMARAAAEGGAAAIRANGGDNIAAIRSAVDLPIIGLVKRYEAAPGITITPDLAAVAEAVGAGADIVAIDATDRLRTDDPVVALIAAIKAAGKQVFADVATVEEGVAAVGNGADFVATTMAGYADPGPPPADPDVPLVAALAKRIDCPVVAEGRYWTAEQIRAAFAAGAHSVVVGTAITNPREITRRLVAATPG